MDKIVEVNRAAIENHLGKMVRSTVEETVNLMREACIQRSINYDVPGLAT